MATKNEKIAQLQREISEKTQALRSILEAEHKAAQALVAETAEALAVLGGNAPAVTNGHAAKRPVGRPISASRGKVRSALAKFGAMTAAEASVAAHITKGAASGALHRLVRDKEATIEKPNSPTTGNRMPAVYELIAGKA